MEFKKIKVKRELLADWLAALRSEKYLQVESTLTETRRDGNIGYCCLGVKCDLEDSEQFKKYFEEFRNGGPECTVYSEYPVRNIEFYAFLKTPVSQFLDVERLLAALNDGSDDVLIELQSVFDLASWGTAKKIKADEPHSWKLSFQNIADFIEEVLVEYID